MLLFPESREIMNCALLTLERLYDTFDAFRPNLEEPILNVMQNIIENADKEEQIKKSAIFSWVQPIAASFFTSKADILSVLGFTCPFAIFYYPK